MKNPTLMRPLLFIPITLCIFLAGCATDDLQETGISRARAIAVAENHCPQYPDRFGYVDRAEWNPDGRYWLVALTDRDGDHGRAFKINRHASIIDTHVITRTDDTDDGPSHHLGYWYYW
jgi:hypothetical protein